MTSRMFFIGSTEARLDLVGKLMSADLGFHVTVKRNKRSDAQNSLMWVMLTEIADQIQWHGQSLSPEDWKLIFLQGLNQELRIVPNMDGNGFVQLGRSSSKLSKDEMRDLITLIEAFGANHNVNFKTNEAEKSNEG